MRRLASLAASVLLALPAAAPADILPTIVNALVDGGNTYAWEVVELPGTTCGNGSQYRFFFHRTASPDLLFFFEGGGACWDYPTCSGRAGSIGAANPNGIPPDYIRSLGARYVSPIVNGADPGLPLRSRKPLPTEGWNVVFMPYCTGDVHIGNAVASYVDPGGVQPPLRWHHAGLANTKAAVAWTRAERPAVRRLLVTGFSAGGTGTAAGYWFVRNGIAPQRGFLLDDSGPIFPAPLPTSSSRPLHDTIRAAWALDGVFAELPPSFDPGDFGSMNRMLSTEFPGDQLAYTGYTRDYDYSRFSYERFFVPRDRDSVLARWKTDQDALVGELAALPNFSYHIPYERPINASHCSTIVTFIGSHACQRVEKKRSWWEYLAWPPNSYKCYSEFVPMETFLSRFIGGGLRERIVEPPNGYNAEDLGMRIVAPIINAAIGGL